MTQVRYTILHLALMKIIESVAICSSLQQLFVQNVIWPVATYTAFMKSDSGVYNYTYTIDKCPMGRGYALCDDLFGNVNLAKISIELTIMAITRFIAIYYYRRAKNGRLISRCL